jgi:hypothetical protein
MASVAVMLPMRYLETQNGNTMHTLSVRTRFAAGDLVRVESPDGGFRASGTIAFFTIDKDSRIDYAVKFDSGGYRTVGGIPEDDIALLERRSTDNLVTIRTKFKFGDHVRFVQSPHHRGGTGIVHRINVEPDGHSYYIDYGILLDSGNCDEPYVKEGEISLLNDAEPY